MRYKLKKKELENSIKVIKNIYTVVYSITQEINSRRNVKEETKMKYTQDVKDKAVALAKEGVALKTIQSTVGPNPKAVQRYLAKAGINYDELKAKLKAEGKLQGATKKQGAAAEKEKVKAQNTNNKAPQKK